MTSSKSKEQREKYKQELADQFKTLLERHGANWVNGIQGAEMTAPENAATGRKYNGSNAFMLMLTSAVSGYDDPRWATMAQIIDKTHTIHPHEKWHLKAGSHGQTVEYWFPYDKEEKRYVSWDDMRSSVQEGRDPEDYRILAKYFYVFNASMIEGISPYDKGIVLHDVQADDLIKHLSESMQVPIILDTRNEAYYSPSQDCIHLPSDPRRFLSSAEYNGTALHELCHSTGNKNRLNRNIRNSFGSAEYAYEELIAEMGSCFMAINLKDIDISAFNRFENNEAYLRSWIKAAEDPDALIKAIKEAQRASDYMEMKVGISSQKEYEEKYGIQKEEQAVAQEPVHEVMHHSSRLSQTHEVQYRKGQKFHY